MPWAAKGWQEEKPLSPELAEMLAAFAKRGGTDEVSLIGLDRRWRFLADLTDPDGPLPDDLTRHIERWEEEWIELTRWMPPRPAASRMP